MTVIMNRGRERPSERGSTLLIALIIITVLAVAGSMLLAFALTSERTTQAVRDQAARTYAADAAAKVALSELKQSRFPGNCAATGGNGLSLGTSTNSFYVPVQSENGALNSLVWCTPDATNGGGGDPTAGNASPGSAILTLGTGSGGEDGIYVSSNAGAVKVRGGIFSNSTINANAGGLQNTYSNPPYLPYNLARGACTNITLITPSAYTQCNYSAPDWRGVDPATLTPHGASYNQPANAPGPATISSCSGSSTYQSVSPGLFTSASALNAMTGCSKQLVVFTPGTYYFDFTDAATHLWTVKDLYVIAGTPTVSLGVTPTVAQMPTACVLPLDPAATTTSGVQFVFGGDSSFTLTHKGNPGAQLTVCASKSSSGPPIAIYGLKSALSGSNPVHAQSGCITAVPPAVRCALIYTDQSPNTTLTVQGTTYAPNAWVNLNLNNSTNQVFRWGLIIRALTIGTTGSADLGNAVIDVPDVAANVNPSPGIVYLTVYVCPAGAACTTDPLALRLRIKAQLTTSTASIAVLSWSWS